MILYVRRERKLIELHVFGLRRNICLNVHCPCFKLTLTSTSHAFELTIFHVVFTVNGAIVDKKKTISVHRRHKRQRKKESDREKTPLIRTALLNVLLTSKRQSLNSLFAQAFHQGSFNCIRTRHRLRHIFHMYCGLCRPPLTIGARG